MLAFLFAGTVVVPPLLGLLSQRTGSWPVLWSVAAGLVGVAGLVLPFLQGILFIAIGLWLLSSESEWARCKRDWLLRRFPQLRPRLERMESHLDERGGRIRAWWWRRWS